MSYWCVCVCVYKATTTGVRGSSWQKGHRNTRGIVLQVKGDGMVAIRLAMHVKNVDIIIRENLFGTVYTGIIPYTVQ